MKSFLENGSLLLIREGMRLLALSCLALGLTVASASAATITVTNTNDSGAGSLRNAIATANAASGDVIVFSVPANSTITLATELIVDKSLTINGSGSPGLAVSGNNTARVFDVAPGVTVAFSNFTIRDGSAVHGGGIYSSVNSTLTLTNCTVLSNKASGNGGGIVSEGVLVLIDSTVLDNDADGNGGGIAIGTGHLSLTNSTVSFNRAGYGGGIDSVGGVITLTDSAVIGNRSATHGGGISNQPTSSLALTNSAVIGNMAFGNGGGIVNDGVATLIGSTVSNNAASGGGSGGGIASGTSSLTLTRSTVSNNTANYGGGLDNAGGTVTLTDSAVIGNKSATHGGGISNRPGGSLTLNGSMVSENTALSNGGGIVNNGTAELTDSTVSNNTAGGSSINDSSGGGIASGQGSLTLTQSTVSGNMASYNGGGIDNYQGTLLMSNSTVYGNQAIFFGGGIHNHGALGAPSIAELTHVTLVGNGTAGDLRTDTNSSTQIANTLVQSCTGAGSITDVGGNLDGGVGCGFIAVTSSSNIVFGLGVLADNGGLTLTMMPNADSPAIDHGLVATCAPVDQRGAPRSPAACTSGAVEFGTAPLRFRLTVNVTGNGSVSETGVAFPQINTCTVLWGVNCTSLYDDGENIFLTATPASGYAFAGWSGDCVGTSLTVSVTMNVAHSCSASFIAATPTQGSTTPIPTLNYWALLLLGGLVTGIAALFMRKPLSLRR